VPRSLTVTPALRGSHTSVAEDVGLDCCIVKKFLWVRLPADRLLDA
jgi:hypothetical protein